MSFTKSNPLETAKVAPCPLGASSGNCSRRGGHLLPLLYPFPGPESQDCCKK